MSGERNAAFSRFLSFLEDGNVLTPESVKRARNAFESTDHPADTVLIELGLTRETDLARHFSSFLQVPELEGIAGETPGTSELKLAGLRLTSGQGT